MLTPNLSDLVIFKSPYIYYGTAGDDVLVSRYTGYVNETFYGYDGNDYIDGGLGADRMIGGNGHDTYVVDNAGDVVVEEANGGFDTVRVSFSYTIPLNVEKLELTGTTAINGYGNDADNRLYGNDSSNILASYGGNDILNGGAGTDTMLGGTGNDTYYVDNAGDVVVEYANEGTDWIASTISFTLAPNVEGGNLVAAGDFNITGNELDNDLRGNGWANVLSGLDGNDMLDGGNGNDTLFGGNGNDTLDGDWSDDILVGGRGLDTLIGGTGGDLFVWADTNETGLTAATADVITDFNIAQGDRIDLSQIDANAYADGDQAFTFIGNAAFSGNPGELNYIYVNGDTIIQMQTGTSPDVEAVIRLEGIVTPDASWFAL
jgi:Ca2+-binding RTX toxin-like protein